MLDCDRSESVSLCQERSVELMSRDVGLLRGGTGILSCCWSIQYKCCIVIWREMPSCLVKKLHWNRNLDDG